MATPTRQEIIARAKELWHSHEARHGNPAFDIEPEICELREEGYLNAARSELTSSPATAHELEKWKEYIQNVENFAEFEFDVAEAMKSGCYVSGTTGTGKSDVGMYSAKALMEHGVIVVVFDSTQDWQTRSSIARFETLNLPYIDKIPELSTVYDISLLSVLQRQRLIEGFCGDIYRYQAMKKANERRQYFLIFEEAHNYFKEGFMRAKRFGNSAMLLSEGRNYSVRFMCITQFANLLDKTAMTYMRLRYFGYSSEPNDTEYIARFFPKEDRDGIKKSLRNLKNGEFLTMNGQIISIKPFESSITKRRIMNDIKPKTEMPKPTPQANYALAKALIVLIAGLAMLWLAIGVR